MRKQTDLPPGKGARGGGVPGSSASLRPWGQADDCQGPSFPAQGRRGGFQRQVLSEAHPGHRRSAWGTGTVPRCSTRFRNGSAHRVIHQLSPATMVTCQLLSPMEA